MHIQHSRVAGIVLAAAALLAFTPAAGFASPTHHPGSGTTAVSTATPIKHLVVLFQENVSFDHYFGTYPAAANAAGEPAFHALPDTPTVNGLSGSLLTANPNLSNPQRLSREEAATCDQDHGYTAEQKAFDQGAMDQFVQNTGHGLTLTQCLAAERNPAAGTGTSPNYAVMDYYDGNTVTGLWNYAQHYAMSDNSYGTTYGPSSPGAISVTAGNTYGALCGPSSAVYNAAPCAAPANGTLTTPNQPNAAGPGTMYSDADPYYDVCSSTQDKNPASNTIAMGGQNIGDLLSSKNQTWGWFQGGFASPNYSPGNPSADDLSVVCSGAHPNILGSSVKDYSPHHEPFQYYASTANPAHLPPTSIAAIGHQDQANHQYDLKDFWAAADNGNLPSVSYLKANAYQDGHAGYSDPLDEQTYITDIINRLQKLPSWSSTAVMIAYDDSDGWYDHQIGPVITQSQTSLDALTGTGNCGSNSAQVPTTSTRSPEQARCGVGPRLPLLVISPYSRKNFIDNTFTSQTSIVTFIEDNWLSGQRIGNGNADATSGTLNAMFNFTHPAVQRLFLNPATGQPTSDSEHAR
ncbi:MAG: alkaline phosphatase family protein [Leifsonia sp.]